MDLKEAKRILDKQKKSHQIEKELGISGRVWRQRVNGYNQNFEERESIIVADRNGYYLTTNKEEIKHYAFNMIKHALSELKNAKKILKYLSDKNQLKLSDEEIDLNELMMKMKV